MAKTWFLYSPRAHFLSTHFFPNISKPTQSHLFQCFSFSSVPADFPSLHRWTRDRGQACRRERIATSNPTQNNSSCPSVRRSLDVHGESETPSTQHRRPCLLRSSKTGENSGLRLRTHTALITQSRALRYQIRLRSIPVRTSSSLSHETHWNLIPNPAKPMRYQ